ncbi:MAG: hypothetical protein LBR92_03115 [Puniceicoccales bacterium]|nr:hypothetical protein [Puniceicoccales bacterium]
MLNNRLVKLRVFALSLLAGASCNGAMASEKSLLTQVQENIEIWQSPEALPEDKAQAKDFLASHEIEADDIYRPEDVRRAWEPKFTSLTRNVVRTNSLKLENGYHLPMIGTGTLVDVGISGLEGRTVITCAHCCGFDDTVDSLAAMTRIDNNGDGAGVIRTYYLEGGPFSRMRSNKYVSITSEIEQTSAPLPICNTLDDFKAALTNGSAYAIEGAYFFATTSSKMKIIQADADGNPLYERDADGNIIYELDVRFLDIAIAILRKPITRNGKIVSGFPFAQLNVANTEILKEITILCKHEDGKPDTFERQEVQGHILGINPANPALIVGYGLTGCVSLMLDYAINQNLEQAVEQNRLPERQRLLNLLGWNTKKAICLNGVDTTYRNCLGCCCRPNDRPGVKAYFPAELKLEECYSVYKANGGFSGSLILDQKMNTDGSWNVIGIFGGSTWTDQLRNAVYQAAEHYARIAQ